MSANLATRVLARTPRSLSLALAGCLLLRGSAPAVVAESPTLGELIERHGLEQPTHLGLPLTESFHSFASHRDDHDELVIAGYLEGRVEPLGALYVVRHDDSEGGWESRQLRISSPGSVTRIERLGELLLLTLHHTPSAATTLLLDAELRLHARIPGWILEVTGEKLLYQASQTHFAPTFEVEVYLYDPWQLSERQLFPPPVEGPYRRSLVELTRAAYADAGRARCAALNHHCDPRRLDTSLWGEVAVQGDDLAFAVSYDESPLDPGGPRRPVLYLYRDVSDLERMQVEEVPLERDESPLSETELLIWLRDREPRDAGEP